VQLKLLKELMETLEPLELSWKRDASSASRRLKAVLQLLDQLLPVPDLLIPTEHILPLLSTAVRLAVSREAEADGWDTELTSQLGGVVTRLYRGRLTVPGAPLSALAQGLASFSGDGLRAGYLAASLAWTFQGVRLLERHELLRPCLHFIARQWRQQIGDGVTAEPACLSMSLPAALTLLQQLCEVPAGFDALGHASLGKCSLSDPRSGATMNGVLYRQAWWRKQQMSSDVFLTPTAWT
jgi:hypothetical protein